MSDKSSRKKKKERGGPLHRLEDIIKKIFGPKGEIIMIVLKIFIIVALGLFAGYAIVKKIPALFGKTRRRKITEIKTPLTEEVKQVSEEEEAKWRELYKKARELENQMVLLIGGKTGMDALRSGYRNPESTLMIDMYRDKFNAKQKRLKEAYEEYYALKEAVDQLPEACGKRIGKLLNDEHYQELIAEKLD